MNRTGIRSNRTGRNPQHESRHPRSRHPTRWTSAAALGIAVTAALLAPATLAAQQLSELSADELLRRADDTLFPESFTATMRMTTERPDRRTTEMLLDNRHLEGEGTLMEVEEPARSRGMRFLQKDEDLWMYNPRAGSRRAIRLSPRDSFQGSVFSNNDVSDPDYADDYTATLAGTETLDHPQLGEVQTTVVEATASHDESAYGRIMMWIWGGESGDRIIPLRFDYYSRSGLLFKRMFLSDIERLAGADRPRTMRMESLEEEGAVTTVRIEALEATDDLPPRIFNQQELTR